MFWDLKDLAFLLIYVSDGGFFTKYKFFRLDVAFGSFFSISNDNKEKYFKLKIAKQDIKQSVRDILPFIFLGSFIFLN